MRVRALHITTFLMPLVFCSTFNNSYINSHFTVASLDF